jgi:hypothetical protein
VIAVSVAVLLIGLGSSWRESFINPAPLSRAHSGPEFVHLAAKQGGGQGCVLCHEDANAGLGSLARSAVKVAQTSLSFAKFTSNERKDFSRMDRSCLSCHEQQSFHHPAVVHETACATCHVHIDPPGFALENFDSDGSYRTMENKTKIDSSGVLDGITFNDAAGLGKAVHDNPATANCLVRRLYSYGQGRAPARGERGRIIHRRPPRAAAAEHGG